MSSPMFTVTAPPSTDIWRKPPNTNSFNAPTHALLPQGPVPLASFHRARVTFSGAWTTRYDQGGLLLHLTRAATRECHTSVQGSLLLIQIGTTIEVRREVDELGSSLWVYELVLGNSGDVLERHPLREVTWIFAEEEGWDIGLSAMAARPAKADDVVGPKELVVEFRNIEVYIHE
ncbi:hypothetical protein F5878DRAFT_649847 [Lentinula raphanica]|uniref:Uncharacterized protein n=1 Tax=Lentinula raphanica TaxID=153919 RepID=A0AA38PH70_9AGAR|nr:hypothetical protein F5880DRAFT_1695419 [Lentinula raphanica]KAJ3842838.1 hypothetical protein F5878DRAFT_649847 [Lentinula raphanica]